MNQDWVRLLWDIHDKENDEHFRNEGEIVTETDLDVNNWEPTKTAPVVHKSQVEWFDNAWRTIQNLMQTLCKFWAGLSEGLCIPVLYEDENNMIWFSITYCCGMDTKTAASNE